MSSDRRKVERQCDEEIKTLHQINFITQKELINEKKIQKIFWIKNFVITFRIV
jgi:hypothetical protein